jgi:hypothetical protein
MEFRFPRGTRVQPAYGGVLQLPRVRLTGGNWLCFARLPPGNADLPIGMAVEIGFVSRNGVQRQPRLPAAEIGFVLHGRLGKGWRPEGRGPREGPPPHGPRPPDPVRPGPAGNWLCFARAALRSDCVECQVVFGFQSWLFLIIVLRIVTSLRMAATKAVILALPWSTSR